MNSCDHLTHLGLSANEASIYLTLLRIGTTQVSRLVIETGLKKATIYDTLVSLEKKGFVHSYIHEETTKFTAQDPDILEHILSQEAQEIRQKQATLQTILPTLYGIRNEHFQVPKIRMYHGFEGMRIVLEDSLRTKDEILTFSHVEAMEAYFHDINADYVKKRIKKGITKRGIVEDTPACHAIMAHYAGKKVTNVKYVSNLPFPHIETNIYDGVVSYITYRDKEPIGIIIEDSDIFAFHKHLFDTLWSFLS